MKEFIEIESIRLFDLLSCLIRPMQFIISSGLTSSTMLLMSSYSTLNLVEIIFLIGLL